MIQYYESSLSKRFYYSKFLYLNTIIMALASFYIFAFTTTTLADAQNATNTNSTEIDTFLETAKNSYNQQKYDEAIQNYDKVLQIEPNNTAALVNKGLASSDLNRYDEAIQYYDKALHIEPNDTDALINKGTALYDLERYDESIQYYDKVLHIDPNDTDALDMKNTALNKLGR